MYEWSVERIKRRAAFELKCEPEKLSVRVLNVTWRDPARDSVVGTYPTHYGVEGCGQRIVYDPHGDRATSSGS